MPLKLQATRWIYLLPLLLVANWILPSKVWIALLTAFGSACLLAFFWSRSLGRGLHLEREMRFGWAQVGDRLEERFTLANQSWLPALWVEIADGSSLPDHHASQVTAIGGQSRNSWRVKTTCTRRGIFTLGPTRLRTGDPLGLFQVELELPGATHLMVMPPVVPLPAIEVAPGGRAGEGRRSRPDPLERTVSASGTRPYQPGDPPRWMHWRLSARHQALFVRNFDSTPSSDWWIFLDLEASRQAGEGWNSTEEHGVILAASLADRGLRLGRAVGLAVCAEELIWLAPRRSAAQRMEILRRLALARPGTTSLAHLLRVSRHALQRGASLVIITPSQEPDWLEALSLLSHSRLAPTVLLFDLASYEAPGEHRSLNVPLARLGISPYLIPRQLLDRPESRPGRLGEWEWVVTGFGRAVPRRSPPDLGWRKVGG